MLKLTVTRIFIFQDDNGGDGDDERDTGDDNTSPQVTSITSSDTDTQHNVQGILHTRDHHTAVRKGEKIQ